MSIYFAPVRREMAAKGFSKATIDALEAIATTAQSAATAGTGGATDTTDLTALQALVAQLQSDLAAAQQAAADAPFLAPVNYFNPDDVIQVINDPVIPASPAVATFIIDDGSTGTNVTNYVIASRPGTFSKCKIVVKASDASTPLTFKIKQNGTDVFSADPTVAAGTVAGTVVTSTSLTALPLTVAADDLFTLDITSGASAWKFTAQLES